MAEIDPREFAFRKMLVDLNKLITQEELSAMKFQCKSVAGIGDKNLNKIETCLELWTKLEERKHLGVNNLSFLKDLLTSCVDNRRDVIDVVLKFEKGHRTYVANGTGNQEDLSKEINFLEDNLGRDWKFFMRALGLPEAKLEICIDSHPRNVKEQIHMAFKECLSDTKMSDILGALKTVNRNDLHHKISKGLP